MAQYTQPPLTLPSPTATLLPTLPIGSVASTISFPSTLVVTTILSPIPLFHQPSQTSTSFSALLLLYTRKRQSTSMYCSIKPTHSREGCLSLSENFSEIGTLFLEFQGISNCGCVYVSGNLTRISEKNLNILSFQFVKLLLRERGAAATNKTIRCEAFWKAKPDLFFLRISLCKQPPQPV